MSSRRGGSPSNLAPGDVPKVGPGLDLALACGVLAASEQLPKERLDDACAVRRAGARRQRASVPGHAGGRAGVRGGTGWRRSCSPPSARARRCWSTGSAVAAARALQSAARVLSGGPPDPLPEPDPAAAPRRGRRERAGTGPERRARPASRGASPDRRGGGRSQLPAERPAGDGQDDARAAGARRSCRRLSRAGGDRGDAHPQHRGRAWRRELAQSRPFSAPHHSITTAGLIGGARRGLGRRGRACPQRRAVPGRALGVRQADAGGAAPAAGGRARGDRQGQALGGVSGALHAASPRPTRARAGTRANANAAAAAKPTWRATAAS